MSEGVRLAEGQGAMRVGHLFKEGKREQGERVGFSVFCFVHSQAIHARHRNKNTHNTRTHALNTQ